MIVALLIGVGVAPVSIAGTGAGAARGASLAASGPMSAATVGLVLALVPSPQTGPAPLQTNLSASISGGAPPYTLTLCFGGSDHTSPAGNCLPPVSGWTGAAPIVRSHSFPAEGNYSVLGVANDSAGESVGSTALVVVTSPVPLIVSAVEQTTAGAAPLSVTFNESVSGSTAPVSLDWIFGDGSLAAGVSGVSVTHVYTTVGTFQPMLDVRDAAGRQTEEALPPITVNRASSPSAGIVPGLGSTAGLELAAAFVVAAAVAASAVTLFQRRRWRREGDELVDWLRDSERTRPPPPRTP